MRGRLALTFLLVAALGACAVVGTEERPAAGGIYREAVVGQPRSLNPLLHPADPAVRDIARLVHAGLVRIVDGAPTADLALDWSTADGGLTTTFRLQPRARWHDGQPVTSADVLATIALLQSPTYPGPAEVAATWRKVRAEAPDPQTVVLRLDEPLSGFLHACSIPILPRHLFAADVATDLMNHSGSFAAVGAGPFRLHSADEEGLRLIRHDAYEWKRPLLEEVHLRFYPDRSSAEQALAAGAVDGFAGITPPEIPQGEAEPRFSLREAPLHGLQQMLILNHANPALADPAVRRAVSAAISRRALIETAMGGHGVPAFIPGYQQVTDPSPVIEGDRAGAARLLDGAGWVGSPIRVRNGRELRLEISTAANSRQVALAEAIAAQLTPLGFRMTIQPVDLLDLFRERLMPRRYDAVLLDVSRGGNDADLYAMWHSSQRQDGLNFAGYGNPTIDNALDQLRAESDPGRRQEALLAFQQVWMDDVPSVVLASPLLAYVTSTQIRGVRLGVLPDASARFQHISEWYTRTERVPVIAGWRG